MACFLVDTDVKGRAASEVVFGLQPFGVERDGRGALHPDHGLRRARQDLPGPGEDELFLHTRAAF